MALSSFSITMRMTDQFFDRVAVTTAMDRANAKALSRVGAFVRRRARSSIRRRKSVSQPGKPPSAHSSDSVATLKNILFVFDRVNESVIIGPVKLNQFNRDARTGSNLPLPQLMEFGGTIAIDEEQYKNDPNGRWFRRDRRQSPRPWKRYRTRRATYAPRPFMGPALAAEQDNIPAAWRGSMSRAA